MRGVSDLLHAWSAPARCSPPVFTPAWQTWTDVSCPGTEALGDVSGHCPAWDGGPLTGSHQLGCCPNSWDGSGMGAWRVPPPSRAPCPGGRGAPGPPGSCCASPFSLASWSSPALAPRDTAASEHSGGSSRGVRGPSGLLRASPLVLRAGEAAPERQRDFLKGPWLVNAAPWRSLGPLPVGILFPSLWGQGQLLLLYKHHSSFLPDCSHFGSWSLDHEETSLLHADPRVCPGMALGVGLNQVPALGILLTGVR